jgi:hypothetical protein
MTDHVDQAPERDDKDDLDLLTYGEVGVRLYDEIEALKVLVREHAKAGDAAACEKVERRLVVLEAARARNSRQPINDGNFEKFFGYKGKAKRTT